MKTATLSKDELKKVMHKRQNGICVISNKPLPACENTELYDLDRYPISGKDGGKYELGNVRALLPKTHSRDRHNNQSIEDENIVRLKVTMDDYHQIIKLRNKIDNQIRAGKRHDVLSNNILDYLVDESLRMNDKVKEIRKDINSEIGNITSPNYQKLRDCIMTNKGLAEISVAELIYRIDIEKAEYPSSLWEYAGLGGSSIDRYKKGQSGGGCQTLRNAVYNIGRNLLKSHNEFYTILYYNRKGKTEKSNTTVKERCSNGKTKEIMWKDATPSHRDLDALRIMNKHFLSDLWYIWRTIWGLNTEDLYVEAHLGHHDIISPFDRGWPRI